jgi:hypothetical protein
MTQCPFLLTLTRARRLAGSSSLAWPLYARKESDVTKDEALRLVELAQAGAPIPEGVMAVALVRTGDKQIWSFSAMQEADEFVDALRKEGLI